MSILRNVGKIFLSTAMNAAVGAGVAAGIGRLKGYDTNIIKKGALTAGSICGVLGFIGGCSKVYVEELAKRMTTEILDAERKAADAANKFAAEASDDNAAAIVSAASEFVAVLEKYKDYLSGTETTLARVMLFGLADRYNRVSELSHSAISNNDIMVTVKKLVFEINELRERGGV